MSSEESDCRRDIISAVIRELIGSAGGRGVHGGHGHQGVGLLETVFFM